MTHYLLTDMPPRALSFPQAPVDKENPEPSDWPSFADRVSPELGDNILNTCARALLYASPSK